MPQVSQAQQSAYALLCLAELKAPARPWLRWDHEHDESDRFDFSIDIEAASPLPNAADEELDDEEYYASITAWSRAHRRHLQQDVDTRPKFYAYSRPWLYPKQEDAIFADARFVHIEASTKSGKTTGCYVRLIEETLRLRPGGITLWCAPTYETARMVFRRLERALPPSVYRSHRSELWIELPNGAYMYFRSADKPNSIYGNDYSFAVLDEASRSKGDIWQSILSTLTATEGQMVCIGNVHGGKENWWYLECRKAESGAPNTAYFMLTWRDAVEAGVLKASVVEEQRERLSEAVFLELYECRPIAGGQAYFLGSWLVIRDGQELRPALIGDIKDPPSSWIVRRLMDWNGSKPTAVGWMLVSDGTEAILSDGSKFCPPAGSRVYWREWYHMVPGQPNVGQRLGAVQTGEGILEREFEWKVNHRVAPGPADGIHGGTNPDPTKRTIAQTMAQVPAPDQHDARVGVAWTKPNKYSGSRVDGWQMMAEGFQATHPVIVDGEIQAQESPGSYICESCTHTIRTIEQAPRSPKNPDDIDSDTEDHLLDMWRYGEMVVASPPSEPVPETEMPELASVSAKRVLDMLGGARPRY